MYWVFYWTLRFLYRVFCRWKVHGLENFPPHGGFILAVNHASFLDPTIAGSAAPRGRLSRWFLTTIHTIPLDNRSGGDIGAFKDCMNTMRKGRPILIFPEGTRSRDGNLQPGKLGIGLLAMMSRADILPCYIHGSYEMFPRHSKFPRPHKLHVFFGPFMPYKEFDHLQMKKESYHKISHRVMEEIGRLRQEALKITGTSGGSNG